MLVKDLTSIDDINTREDIRYEQERIVRKKHQKQQQQPASVTQNFFGQYFGDLEVPDQIDLTISVVDFFFL